MTIVRCVAGLAAVLSAMLVQATVVGPLVYPVPVSLPLLVVVGVAVLSGPATGIALGFGAGLLADLTSRHPVGLLALVWMGAGIVAGIVGGVVVGGVAVGSGGVGGGRGVGGRVVGGPVGWARVWVNASVPRSKVTLGRLRGSRPVRTPRSGRTPGDAAPAEMSHWRAQGLLTGMISVAATGCGLVALAAVGSAEQAMPGALVLLIPAGLVDAVLAVPVLALARVMLAAPALRPVVATRLGTGIGAGAGTASVRVR